MSPDTFMSWRCPNGGLEIEGRSWVSHLFLSPAQGLRQPWIHIRYQLTVTELLNGNLLGLSALLNSTQLALPHGILSTSRYFMRVVTPSWLDRQSETKGLCLKPNTFTLLNFYNWDILLWMKLDKMTPSLRFVGLGKYSCWLCFVLFEDAEMNAAGQLAGSQTAVLASEDDTGQRREAKQGSLSK